MSAVEPAIPMVLAAAALLAGGDDVGWLLVIGAVLAFVIRRWEAYAVALPGAAGVAAGLAAEGLRWHLLVAAIALVAGAVVVVSRRLPSGPLDPPRIAATVVAAAFVVAAGWLPVLDLDQLEAYSEGAVLAAAAFALVLVAAHSTAALRARSGKLEDPAAAGGADPGA